MPKVSIVLPTYNGEKYIRESIDSIINQTFIDWELIIVNDCSTDNTQKIIDTYVETDNRISTIKNDINKKLPESLNIGFRKAQGEYLTWTSDDNMYLPEALETMADFLEKNRDSVLVCASMNMVDSDGNFLMKHCDYTYEDMLCDDCVGACFMYRRCVLKDIGEYDPTRFLVEDYDYWLRILFYYGKIEYIDKILYLYRVHGNSLTGKRKKDIHEQLLSLQENYALELVERLKIKKDLLCRVYYELQFGGRNNQKVKNIFLREAPEIGHERKGSIDKPIIIYGAGTYGQKAYEKYRDKVVFFADRNEKKVGERISGIEILSVDRLQNLQNEYAIMIAVYSANIYSCIMTLEKYGVKNYYIYQP